ncbi:unnamed protein product [Cuscuta campestris]|uniref:Uncharacterized protein n=1 Tax=Cuscuta campestris TaxID=132261 RepID=A0A484LP10_9ASTE|nr:unnamed protein product [Cuscuta campestris]
MFPSRCSPLHLMILCSIYRQSFSSRWQLIVTKLMEPNVGVLNASPVYASSVDDDEGVVDSFSFFSWCLRLEMEWLG